MIAVLAADDDLLVRLTAREPVLPGDLEGRFVRLRPAGEEVGAGRGVVETSDESGRELLLWLISEERRMRKCQRS